MAVQDRNVSRNARHSRNNISVALPASEIDVDAPVFAMAITKAPLAIGAVAASAELVATAEAKVRASIAPASCACGNVDAAALSKTADLTTIAYGAFYQNVEGVPTLIATGTAVLPAFVIAAGKWGSVLLQVTEAGVVTCKPANLIGMSYVSRKVALGATPQPDMDPAAVNGLGDPIPQGVIGMLQIQALAGATFTGATDSLDTDTTAVEDEGRSYLNADLLTAAFTNDNAEEQDDATRLIDGSGLRKGFGVPAHIDKAGNVIRQADLICLTLRGVGGIAAITVGTGVLSTRPFPAQGEGLPGATASAIR